jgi:dTDP-4-amino-4,6-dideoxygalactose transaminase
MSNLIIVPIAETALRSIFLYLSAMRVPYLDLKPIHDSLREELDGAYRQVMDESYFVHGSAVTNFEKAFAQKLGVEHCLAVGNCTDALFIVLKMLGVGQGHEVLVPAMTWISDAEVVSNLGAVPVFVDVDAETYCIDVAQLEEKITPRTKAIVPVHLYGQMANMDSLMKVAEAHGLWVVEDCAQAHFAQQNSAMAGTVGHAAVFSFYPTKNLGALGDAGAIVTNDKALYTACRKMANHGALDKHDHEFAGMNSRMDTLQAAVLNIKLKYIDCWNKERNALALRYFKGLEGISAVQLPHKADNNEHVYHVFQVLIEHRDDLKAYLKDCGVQTQIHYPKALPFTKAYSTVNTKATDFPVAFKLQNQALSLPVYPGLEHDRQDFVIAKMTEFFNGS